MSCPTNFANCQTHKEEKSLKKKEREVKTPGKEGPQVYQDYVSTDDSEKPGFISREILKRQKVAEDKVQTAALVS